MNYIIFDLEATCWNGAAHGRVSEIIEIGAVKVNNYVEATSTFSRFVKPILYPNLSLFCKQLTTIEQRQIDKAAGFEAVIDDFIDWLEEDDDDYVLCSWGNDDRKMLFRDIDLHRLDDYWLCNKHVDLKSQYARIRKLNKPCGLARAVQNEFYEFEGTPHRGIDDAINTAKIFGKLFGEWRFY